MVALSFEEMKVPLFSRHLRDTYSNWMQMTVLRNWKSGLRKLRRKSIVRIQQVTKMHTITMEIAKIKTEPLISDQLIDNLGDTWIIRCGNIIVPLASERAGHFSVGKTIFFFAKLTFLMNKTLHQH